MAVEGATTRAISPAAIVTALIDRRPTVFRACATHLVSLLTPESVTYLLRDAIPEQDVRLVNRGAMIDRSAVANAAGVARLQYCWAMFAAGYTLVLNKVRRRLPAIDAFCLVLEQAVADAGLMLHRRATVNAYVAPAGGDSFGLHADGYGTLLIQTRGSKRWRVHERLPGIRAGIFFADGAVASPLAIDEVIEAGDALVIPHGCAHHGVAAGAESYHITIGLPILMISDVVEDFAEQTNRRFPYCRRDRIEARASLNALFDEMTDVGAVTATLQRLAARSEDHRE